MGACTSLPKGMKGEASAAPPPEPAKEESVQADWHTTEEVINVEKEENKANGVDETKQQSLGSLLDEKEPNEAQNPQVEAAEEPKQEEPKPEPKKEKSNDQEANVEPKQEEPDTEKEQKEEPKVEHKKEETKTEAPPVQKVTE